MKRGIFNAFSVVGAMMGPNTMWRGLILPVLVVPQEGSIAVFLTKEDKTLAFYTQGTVLPKRRKLNPVAFICIQSKSSFVIQLCWYRIGNAVISQYRSLTWDTWYRIVIVSWLGWKPRGIGNMPCDMQSKLISRHFVLFECLFERLRFLSSRGRAVY